MSIFFEIRSRIDDPFKIIPLIGLYTKRALKAGFKISSPADQRTIDIVIPTVSKDYPLFQMALEAARKHVRQPIGDIYVISRADDEIKRFCSDNKLIFIDEESVLGYGKKAIDYSVNGEDRSGWLFQQLLKLGANRIAKNDAYLVVDSDTILLNDHSFIQNGRYMLCHSSEWHQPYFKAHKKILETKPAAPLSFISHMMIFDKKVVAELKRDIEKHTGASWDKAIISTIDPREASCFAEYETYGNYILTKHPEKVFCPPFYNRSLSRDQLKPLAELEKSYSKKYNSVSFHSYKQ
jgi:hypothetical protein